MCWYDIISCAKGTHLNQILSKHYFFHCSLKLHVYSKGRYNEGLPILNLQKGPL